MEDKLKKLKELSAELMDLSYTQSVLHWDQQTYMPAGGAEDRADLRSTLARLIHTKATSPELGGLLEDLKPLAQQSDDSDDTCLVRLSIYQYEKRTRVPADWVAEDARATAIAQSVWEQAKPKGDFAIFQPHLEKIVALRRQYAQFFAPYDHVYDPLLDKYERGMKTAEVKSIFNILRPQQVELIQKITSQPPIDDSFLCIPYPEKGQWDFGVEVITRFGYDWRHGRQDKVAHPFTTSFGLGDVRITTRFLEDRVASAMFSTMHEAGHALYDAGLDRSLRRTPLAHGASMAVHESQSRMWENLVGRSRAFWRFFYPRLQKIFPTQLGNVGMEAFYRAINKVTPSFIRTEADEATYNLHIMLRLELEIALMEGSLQVADVPEAWNTRMKENLGVTPPDHTRGVLQDIHWSDGLFGYFPTYALGNLVAAQLWECINRDIPDLENQIEHGEFANLLGWLRRNIHRHGAKYEPQVLVQKVTGSTINPQPYIRYLKTKYSDIYKL